jgi:glycosyltransferase involved in cell wall biosynthesis
MSLELSVIVPAYNEREAIGRVVADWCAELDRLAIDYELRVYDDGSTDGTADALARVAATRPRLVALRHANRGHGPTVLRGYREARGEWVFQTDGDGEASPADFEALWSRRHAYDFLVGRRVERQGGLARRALTFGCRASVRLLFASPIRDANCPYRLMRRTALATLLPALPDTVFAPNAILSGLAARARLRICEIPIRWTPRGSGRSSIFGLRMWAIAWRAFRESAAVARRRR